MLGDEVNIADSLNNLGYLLVLLEEHAQARPLLEESLSLAERLEDTRHIALAVGNLALVSLFTGENEDARARFVECIRLSEQLGDKRGVLEAVRGLAAIAAQAGALGDAARLQGAAIGLNARAGGTPSPGEALIDARLLAPARARLGTEPWDRTSRERETLELDQAVTIGLEGTLDG